NPASQLDGEADLIGGLSHDLEGARGGAGEVSASRAAIGEAALEEGEGSPRETEQRAAAIAVLDTRRMGLDDEAAAVGVDQRVTLAPVDLLARIVTARAAGLGGLDALAVDDRGRGVASRPTRSRSAVTSAWFIRSKRPSSPQAANQRKIVAHGGKSFGSSRHGQPARMT